MDKHTMLRDSAKPAFPSDSSLLCSHDVLCSMYIRVEESIISEDFITIKRYCKLSTDKKIMNMHEFNYDNNNER
jgi:hypothetical protein